MSFISDFLVSDGGEEAYNTFRAAAILENARERYAMEREEAELAIDDGYDEYEDYEDEYED